MHVTDLHHRSVEYFVDLVEAVDDGRWDGPTPCPDWDVRGLVNHVVYEDLWTVPLMEGATIAVVAGTTVHLSFGDAPAEEYAWQLAADHVIHGWDLAAAAGLDRTIAPEVVEALAGWYAGREEAYRSSGAVGDRPAGARTDSPQDRLLVAFGRDPEWSPPSR
jgi:hypothetical protein